jgi:hypothetical protein
MAVADARIKPKAGVASATAYAGAVAFLQRLRRTRRRIAPPELLD